MIAATGSAGQRSAWGLFAAVAAAALALAISPAVASHTFTPKYAVLLLIAAVGLVPFLRSVRWSRDALSSWAAAAFLLIGLISALVSASPAESIFGLYLWGTGWLMWLGCAGAFGIGLQLRTRADFDWLFGGFVVGAAGNALLALYQTLATPSSSTFGPYQGNQADGFLGNPIHLEALLLGVIAIVAAQKSASFRSIIRWAPLLMLMSVALEFSDERFAVALLPVLFLGLVIFRGRRGALTSGIIAISYMIGYLGGGSSLGGRLSQGASSPGFGLRLHIWKVAARALLQHPAIGSGPGLFEAGTLHLLTQRLNLELGPNRFFSDAHNIVIEVAVTTGVLGLLAFAAWVLGALLRARNLFALFALAGLAVELVEPLNIAITPLIFLALGASALNVSEQMSAPDTGQLQSQITAAGRITLAGSVIVSLVVGTAMLVGDNALTAAPPNGYHLADARLANELLPYWPQSASAMAMMYLYDSAVSHRPSLKRHDLQVASSFLDAAHSRAPFDPVTAAMLAEVEATLGHLQTARAEYHAALRADPWSAQALSGLAQIAVKNRNWKQAASYYRLELSVLAASSLRAAVSHDLSAVLHHRAPSTLPT